MSKMSQSNGEVQIMDIQNLKTNTIKGLKWFFYSFIWLFILMFAIDVISKQLVIANRESLVANASGQGFVLIPNFLAVNYVINHNVAFGIKIGNNEIATRAVYIVVALIASGAIVAYSILKRKTNGKYVKACLMLILAGALGNCVDRIFFTGEMLSTSVRPNETNGVVDWINFFGIWKFNFNWADSCLVVGVIMLLV